jgi:hypothetical protein
MLATSFDLQRSLRCVELVSGDSTFDPGDVYGVRNDPPDFVGPCNQEQANQAMSYPLKGERYQILIVSRCS